MNLYIYIYDVLRLWMMSILGLGENRDDIIVSYTRDKYEINDQFIDINIIIIISNF
jgi:hypothetical protein